MKTPFGARVLRWLNATSERIQSDSGTDWQIEGLHRSLRLTLSWLCEGRPLEEASPPGHLCSMAPGGLLEIRSGTEVISRLPLALILGRAGILLHPGEAILLDPNFLGSLLEMGRPGSESLDPESETGFRHRPPAD